WPRAGRPRGPPPRWFPSSLRPARRRLLRGEYTFFLTRKFRRHPLGLSQEGGLVATCTAYVDPPLQEHLGRAVGFLGQFETEPAVDLSRLLEAAHEWLGSESASEVWAPANCPFQIELGGGLTEGGDQAAPFFSTWTPPHYAAVWEPAGYQAIQSFHNYVVDLTAADLPDRIADWRRRAETNGVSFRFGDRKAFDADLRTLAGLYNATFDRHW